MVLISFLLQHLAHQVPLLLVSVSVGIMLYVYGRGTHVNIPTMGLSGAQ